MTINSDSKNVYYRVTANYDRTEGRGAIYETPFAFYKKAHALAFVTSTVYADKYGVQGCKGNEFDIREVPLQTMIYENLQDAFDDCEIENKKKKALAKLTQEERKILGLE